MTRMILTGALALATGLMAQQAAPPKQGQPAQQQGQAQAKGPAPKSQAEAQAIQAMFQNAQNPDGAIKAAEELLTKFADTDFKEIALYLEATAYQQKGDTDKAQIFGDQVLAINPKNFQVTLMMGEILAQKTRENDLDKEEKLTKATKYLDDTIDNLKTAQKPNPQVSDQQWEEGKKYITAEAHNGLGLVALARKKYDVAITEFKTAVDIDPQATYSVRLASAYQLAGKNDEALAICDKLLADPQLHPQIKAVATNIKNAASKK
jgi:tetratricopeptide (TPR) repeat protein